MADNLVTQSVAPATVPAGTAIAARAVTYSGDTAEYVAPVGLVTFSGSDDAKTATDVTSANPLPVTLVPATSGGGADYHKVAAGSNNAASIKGAAGQVYGVQGFSVAAYPVYVKLYDKATAPNPAADTPVRTIGMQAGVRCDDDIGNGLAFALGIGIAIVKGIGDADNTAVLASDCVVDVDYK